MTDTTMVQERPQQARRSPIDTNNVVGWGVDADPKNDPTYPYRKRENDDGLALNWQRPTQQQSDVEILQSVEYEHFPAVFGTATPPRGLSGMMRRAAFRWSESNWLHWLILMGADRVDMVEGLVEDVARAKVPNIPKEMGVRAEWKHNKKGLATKIGIAAAIGGGIWLWVYSRSRDSNGGGEASAPARSD